MIDSVATTPVIKRVRAFFAPVDRNHEQPTLFDPSQSASFLIDSPPAPWIDLGWITGFSRQSATLPTALRTGAPASTALQVRAEMESVVSFAFQSWGKLQMSLASGVQQMNVLSAAPAGATAGSGGIALGALPLGPATTASILDVGAAAASQFGAGSWVVVDSDYSIEMVGYVGSGISGAYIKSALSDVDYVRRVSLNVGRVLAVSGGLLTLLQPLPGGVPTAGMKVSPVVGFCDREGATFFQEWSALFVAEGQQGERVMWHYPRLQTAQGIAEEKMDSPGSYVELLLKASFRALPVTDACDGERVLCFRSYVPG